MPKISKLVVAEDCAGLGPLLPCCKFLGLNPIQCQCNFSCSDIWVHPESPSGYPILRLIGLKAIPYYMSEKDSALRDRLKELYNPRILSDDCMKEKGNLPPFKMFPLRIWLWQNNLISNSTIATSEVLIAWSMSLDQAFHVNHIVPSANGGGQKTRGP